MSDTMTATGAAAVRERGESPFFRGAAEVAAYLREDESTVRRRFRRHEIPYYKMGKTVLVRKSELEGVLEGLRFPAYGAKNGKGGAR